MSKLILASTSLRRKDLLAKAGFEYEVIPSDYEEDMTLDMDPRELVMLFAQEKARSVAEKFPDAVVIGADTVIAFGNRAVGKPHTPQKAKETLSRLSGSAHSVLTGFCIMHISADMRESRVVETHVYFKHLSENEVDSYIATGEPLDRAGAYAIQAKGKFLIDRIDGDYTNVVGFPVQDISEVLASFGIRPRMDV